MCKNDNSFKIIELSSSKVFGVSKSDFFEFWSHPNVASETHFRKMFSKIRKHRSKSDLEPKKHEHGAYDLPNKGSKSTFFGP